MRGSSCASDNAARCPPGRRRWRAELGWRAPNVPLPDLSGLQGPCSQLVVRRIPHFFQCEPVSRHHCHRRVPHLPSQHSARPVHLTAAVAHRDHRPHQRPHHRVTEGICDHSALQQPRAGALPREVQQSSHRAGAFTLLAERREVVLSQQLSRRSVHPLHIQRPPYSQYMPSRQRIPAGLLIAEAIHIPAGERGEPRVKALWSHRDRLDDHIRRQDAVQRSQEPERLDSGFQVEMRHLTTSVYAGVRPPGACDGQPLREPQYGLERLFERSLHGPETILTSPAMERCPVVLEVNPPTHTSI